MTSTQASCCSGILLLLLGHRVSCDQWLWLWPPCQISSQVLLRTPWLDLQRLSHLILSHTGRTCDFQNVTFFMQIFFTSSLHSKPNVLCRCELCDMRTVQFNTLRKSSVWTPCQRGEKQLHLCRVKTYYTTHTRVMWHENWGCKQPVWEQQLLYHTWLWADSGALWDAVQSVKVEHDVLPLFTLKLTSRSNARRLENAARSGGN